MRERVSEREREGERGRERERVSERGREGGRERACPISITGTCTYATCTSHQLPTRRLKGLVPPPSSLADHTGHLQQYEIHIRTFTYTELVRISIVMRDLLCPWVPLEVQLDSDPGGCSEIP